jgi:hypothetical protein
MVSLSRGTLLQAVGGEKCKLNLGYIRTTINNISSNMNNSNTTITIAYLKIF